MNGFGLQEYVEFVTPPLPVGSRFFQGEAFNKKEIIQVYLTSKTKFSGFFGELLVERRVNIQELNRAIHSPNSPSENFKEFYDIVNTKIQAVKFQSPEKVALRLGFTGQISDREFNDIAKWAEARMRARGQKDSESE